MSKEQQISNIYYDPAEGFGSASDVLKRAKENDPTITMQDVRAFLKKQPNKQIRKHRGHNSYTAPFARFQYQIDIMDMVPLTRDKKKKGKEVVIVKNNEPRYGLVVIDIFSKRANVVPMKNKDGASVLPALKETFEKMGYPMSIYSDDDGAFKSVVKKFFDDEGIQHIITLTHANVAERFIRTMKNMIHDRVRFNRGSWTAMLKLALEKYNKTAHSTTKEKPIEAHKDENHMPVRVNQTLKEKNTRKYDTINVGDMVKVYQKGRGNYTDRKEYLSKWSNRSYRVQAIEYDATGNRVFKLQGLERRYLRHEVLKV